MYSWFFAASLNPHPHHYLSHILIFSLLNAFIYHSIQKTYGEIEINVFVSSPVYQTPALRYPSWLAAEASLTASQARKRSQVRLPPSSVKISNNFNSATTALCKCIQSFITARAVIAQGFPAPVGFQHKDSPVAFLLQRC